MRRPPPPDTPFQPLAPNASHQQELGMNVPMENFPGDLDLYVSGSPCQTFSQANKNPTGTASRRGRLIYRQVDYISLKRPKGFVLENVATLKTQFKGVRKQILKRCSEAGYNVSWKIMNAAEHGLAQTRPRMYIVGLRKDVLDEKKPFSWPKRLPHAKNLTQSLL